MIGPANPRPLPALVARPLRAGERDLMAKTLAKAGLPADDLGQPSQLLFRFDTAGQLLAGFGGLEICDSFALMRSVVTLPPLRGRGFGRAIVAALEAEAAMRKCEAIHLLTETTQDFFEALGYREVRREDVPPAIRSTAQFSGICPASATVLMKRLA